VVLVKCHYVGVDVGAKELVVAIDRDGSRESRVVFANQAEGHQKLIRWATKRGANARVVLESTGVYGLDLAFALHRAERVEVMVANPRAVSAFARASMQRSKTDALDAETILEFCLRMPFVSWTAPESSILELRALSRRIEAMSKAVTQEKNRLHASNQSEELSDFVREDIRELVELIQGRIGRLRKQALSVIEQNRALAKAFGHVNQRDRGL
jgi:transposase